MGLFHVEWCHWNHHQRNLFEGKDPNSDNQMGLRSFDCFPAMPCRYNLSEAALSGSMKQDLNYLPRNSVQFSSVAQSCLTLCDPTNRSMPGLPVHHQLPEFIQTHVHQVGDAMQPSHPLSAPYPSAPNPSQHQDLFQ